MKKISTKGAIIVLIILSLVGLSVIYALSKGQKEVSYSTIKIEPMDIIQTVTETGTVKADKELDLSFLSGGKLQRLNFAVGDKVGEGQLIAELDYSSSVISKQEAQANLDVAIQNLNKLEAGATDAERRVAEATVRQAQTSLDSAENEFSRIKATQAETVSQAEKNLADLEDDSAATLTTQEQAIITAKNNLDNAKNSNQLAINNARDSALVAIGDKLITAGTALDAVNRVITDEDGEDYLSVKAPEYLNKAKSSYNDGLDQKRVAENSLVSAKISKSENAVRSALTNAIYALEITITSLENIFNALDNSVTTSAFSQSDIDSHKTSISTQLSTMNAALAALESSEQAYDNAIQSYDTSVDSAQNSLSQAQSAYDNALLSARNTLNNAKFNSEQQITAAESRVRAAEEALQVAIAQKDKVIAPANSYDITLNKAKIRQAQAALDSINKQIENNQIKSPITGVVTNVNYEIGEQVTSGQAVVSVLGESGYEIEVLISEADIAKIKLGDKAEIDLDAFGHDDEFEGEVVFIEPAETVVQDVIYYQVTVSFDPGERDVKSGMTANIVITTNEKSSVIAVPSRAIIDRNGDGKFVRLLINDQVKERKVLTGLRGDGGNIEILDGLKSGDVLITRIEEE